MTACHARQLQSCYHRVPTGPGNLEKSLNSKIVFQGLESPWILTRVLKFWTRSLKKWTISKLKAQFTDSEYQCGYSITVWSACRKYYYKSLGGLSGDTVEYVDINLQITTNFCEWFQNNYLYAK